MPARHRAEQHRRLEAAPHAAPVLDGEVARERVGRAAQRVRIRRFGPHDQLGARARERRRLAPGASPAGGRTPADPISRGCRRSPARRRSSPWARRRGARRPGAGGRRRTPDRATISTPTAAAPRPATRMPRSRSRQASSSAPLSATQQRGDAERAGQVGDLDDDRHEGLRDRQVVREHLRHPDLDRDHQQRREHDQRQLRRAAGSAGPPTRTARTPAPGSRPAGRRSAPTRSPACGRSVRAARSSRRTRPRSRPCRSASRTGRRACASVASSATEHLRHQRDPHQRPQAERRHRQKQQHRRQQRQAEADSDRARIKRPFIARNRFDPVPAPRSGERARAEGPLHVVAEQANLERAVPQLVRDRRACGASRASTAGCPTARRRASRRGARTRAPSNR